MLYLLIDLTTIIYLSLVSSTVSIQRDTDPVRVVVLQSKCYASTQGYLPCDNHVTKKHTSQVPGTLLEKRQDMMLCHQEITWL